MNTLSISIDDNFIIINTIEFYCVIFKNLKIDGSLFGVVANVPILLDRLNSSMEEELDSLM